MMTCLLTGTQKMTQFTKKPSQKSFHDVHVLKVIPPSKDEILTTETRDIREEASGTREPGMVGKVIQMAVEDTEVKLKVTIGHIIKTDIRVKATAGQITKTGIKVKVTAGQTIKTGIRVKAKAGQTIKKGIRVKVIAGQIITTDAKVEITKGHMIRTDEETDITSDIVLILCE